MTGRDVAHRTLAEARRRFPRAYTTARGAYREMRFRGNAHGCPICGRTFDRWEAPSDIGWLRICPFCGSHARHRMLWRWLPEVTDLFRTSHRVMHFAPEPCIAPHIAALPNVTYVSGDLEYPADVTLDIAHLPFPDAAFDVVMCNHVFECVPDDAAAMREVARILRPGGWATLLVPYDPDEATTEGGVAMTADDRFESFGFFDNVRKFGADYPSRLEAAGFDLRLDRYADRLDPSVIEFYGMDSHETMILGIRRAVA